MTDHTELASSLAEMTGGFDLRRDAIAAALDAAAVRGVKPLEWKKPPEANTLTRAETIVGTYRVWTPYDAQDRWFVTLKSADEYWSFEARDEASCHAAAQADYEKRILSALVPGDASALDAAYRRGEESMRERAAERAEDACRAARRAPLRSIAIRIAYAIRALPPVSPGDGWMPIETAPKDGTPIWAVFRSDIYPILRPGRPDLECWNGVQACIRHPGIAADGFDIGWNMAAPVGHGGFATEWIAGSRPLPSPPTDHTPEEET